MDNLQTFVDSIPSIFWSFILGLLDSTINLKKLKTMRKKKDEDGHNEIKRRDRTHSPFHRPDLKKFQKTDSPNIINNNNINRPNNSSQENRQYTEIMSALFKYMLCHIFLIAILLILEYISSKSIDDSNFSFWMIIHNLIFLLWIIPVSIGSRIFSMFWFNDLANYLMLHYNKKKRIRSIPHRSSNGGMSDGHLGSTGKNFINNITHLVLLTVLLIENWLLFLLNSYVPTTLTYFIYYLSSSMVYALTAFDYKWSYQGISVSERYDRFTKQWPYFFGFGLWMAILLYVTSYSLVLNGAMYSIFFCLQLILIFLTDNDKPSRLEKNVKILMEEFHVRKVNFRIDHQMKLFHPSVVATGYITNYTNKLVNSLIG
ncbi:hypothetical protein SNEBB_001261 [Seison nebaliae]|nr:hypothetical protein SNEBB_001261 [Seison nebaliae]